jgi:hypothetical protein
MKFILDSNIARLRSFWISVEIWDISFDFWDAGMLGNWETGAV